MVYSSQFRFACSMWHPYWRHQIILMSDVNELVRRVRIGKITMKAKP